MKPRPICKICSKKPVAVNYKRNSITYYRTRCDSCIRKGKKLPTPKPNWLLSGYKKKSQCEKCGFTSSLKEHFFVFHLDGNMNNTNNANLKTICANCQIEIAKSNLGWARGDLVPDQLK